MVLSFCAPPSKYFPRLMTHLTLNYRFFGRFAIFMIHIHIRGVGYVLDLAYRLLALDGPLEWARSFPHLHYIGAVMFHICEKRRN